MAQQPSRGAGIPQQQQQQAGAAANPKQLQPQSTQQPALSVAPNAQQPIQIPGAGAVTGVSVSKTPRPLNGQELGAVVIYQLAASLAAQFAVNGRLSEIAAFTKHKLRMQVLVEVVNPTDQGDVIRLEAAKQLELDLGQANVDYLRAEAGIGLWHEGRSVGSGTVVEFRYPPTKAVLEHLKLVGPELVKDDAAQLSGLDLMISGYGR